MKPTKGHRALRKGRYSESHRSYLLTATTRDRRPLFSEFYRARIIVHAMRYLHSQSKVDSLAFVVMPDHIHWLCIPQQNCNLSTIMHSLKSWTSHELKTRFFVEGTVWQTAYHDRALRCEENIRDVARYIVANPLRAGLVTNIGDYPHWDAVWL